jgi:hypothetical protein
VSKHPQPSALLYPVLLAVSIAMFVAGFYLMVQDPTRGLRMAGIGLLAVGAACSVAVLLVWPITSMVNSLCINTSKHQEELLATMSERLQQMSIAVNTISEQQLISDRAKTVAYREKDRDALRRAIREEMGRKDYEAARALVDDMERTFGYRQEAAQFRSEIDSQQQEIVRKQVADAVQVIDRHIRGEQWEEAHREAVKLAEAFPGNEQVLRLPQEIEARRSALKKQLVDSLKAAAARHDNDGAIEILKQVDPYLTRDEAAELEDLARGVFKERLANLKTQFSAAALEHRYAEAVRLGDIIIAEYPNTRIAQEVRDMMNTLRQRAATAEPAKA